MANEIVAQLILATDRFNSALKEAKNDAVKGGEDVGDGLSAGFLKGWSPALTAIAGIGAAIAGGIKAVQIAEEIQQVSRQFDILSERAGISGLVLQEGLENAADGLIGTDDLLKIANKSLIDLGENAAKLPQLLEVARKGTAVFGGDLEHNFEAINQSITNLSTRGLKNLGIVIDQGDAYKKYAREIGKSVEALTAQDKQAALLNATLARGAEAFKDVEVGTNKGTEAFKRLQVQLNDAGQSLALLVNKAFGEAITAGLNGAATALSRFNTQVTATFGDGADKLRAQEQIISGRIKDIEKTLAEHEKFPNAWRAFDASTTIPQLEKLKVELAAVRAELAAAETERAAREEAAAPKGLDPEFEKALVQQNAARLQAEMASATSSEEFQRIQNEKKLQIEDEFSMKLREMRTKFLDTDLVTKEQFARLEIALNQEKNAKLREAQAQEAKALGSMRDMAINSFVSGLVSAFAAVSGALANNEDAWAALAKSVLQTIGSLAIQIGTFILTTALAMNAVGFFASAAAIPLAIGLIALGVALGAAASFIKTGPPAAEEPVPTAGAGGITTGPNGFVNSTSATSTDQEEMQRGRQNQVIVQIQGNVLDRRETGLEIAQILNDTLNSNGQTVIRGESFA